MTKLETDDLVDELVKVKEELDPISTHHTSHHHSESDWPLRYDYNQSGWSVPNIEKATYDLEKIKEEQELDPLATDDCKPVLRELLPVFKLEEDKKCSTTNKPVPHEPLLLQPAKEPILLDIPSTSESWNGLEFKHEEDKKCSTTNKPVPYEPLLLQPAKESILLDIPSTSESWNGLEFKHEEDKKCSTTNKPVPHELLLLQPAKESILPDIPSTSESSLNGLECSVSQHVSKLQKKKKCYPSTWISYLTKQEIEKELRKRGLEPASNKDKCRTQLREYFKNNPLEKEQIICKVKHMAPDKNLSPTDCLDIPKQENIDCKLKKKWPICGVVNEMKSEASESVRKIRHMPKSELFECALCSSVFNNVCSLKTHVQNNHLPAYPKCTLCKRIFSCMELLQDHLKLDNCSFICELCGARYKNKSKLSYHILTHTDEKPFKCQTCGKCFKIKSYLYQHSLSHSIDFTHTCQYCQKGFRSRTHLSDHVRRIHKESGRFECAHCSKVFNKKFSLLNHIRYNHSPGLPKCSKCKHVYSSVKLFQDHLKLNNCNKKSLICELCGKMCTSKFLLTQHISTHTDEKPFMCQTCGKCFKTESNLDQHSVTHSELRPYICDICSKSFRIRNHLRQHMAVHGLVNTVVKLRYSRKKVSSAVKK